MPTKSCTEIYSDLATELIQRPIITPKANGATDMEPKITSLQVVSRWLSSRYGLQPVTGNQLSLVWLFNSFLLT